MRSFLSCMIATFATFATFSLGAAMNYSFTTMRDCSITSHTGHIRDMSFDPAAPVAGEWVLVSVDYDLDSQVTDGIASYGAAFNGFPLTPTEEPLCLDLANTTSACPIAPGPVFYKVWIQMGDGVLHGTLDATTTWTDQNGEQILCWGFTVRF